MTVALVMIVRDNAPVLGRALLSVRDHVDDWTIVDTGSTDDTIAVARAAMAGTHGQLLERSWVNSGHNRSEALALARGTADYLLVLDADQELVVDGALPELTAPAYMLVEHDHGLQIRKPLLIRNDRDWCYIGAAHEYLAGTEGRESLDAWAVIHHGDGRAPAEKLQVALQQLGEAVAADPNDSRSVFYLAQTHADLGNVGEAIHMYTRRIQMAGWDEETFYAHYRLGCLLCENVGFDQGAAELLAAWRSRPQRIEPLRALANAANHIADHAAAPADALFVHRDLYTA